MVRGTSLSNFHRLVTDLGADPESLLTGAGLDPDAAGRFDVFIPLGRVVVALETAAASTGAADFGRRLSRLQGVEILGPVGVAARNAATVDGALRIFEKFLGAYSPAISMRVTPGPEQCQSFIEYHVLGAGLPGHAQGDELTLGVILQILRLLLGRTYVPVSAHLPHEALVPHKDYEEFFGCPTHFAEFRTGFTIRTTDLRRPLARDEATHDAVVGYLTATRSVAPRISVSVRTLVRQLLPGGVLTLDVVAGQFAVHPKTLQRQLASEGASFGAIVDDVRRELAQQYLRDTRITLAHLARELGNAHPSVLTRACRRWFGCSPATYRKRMGIPAKRI